MGFEVSWNYMLCSRHRYPAAESEKRKSKREGKNRFSHVGVIIQSNLTYDNTIIHCVLHFIIIPDVHPQNHLEIIEKYASEIAWGIAFLISLLCQCYMVASICTALGALRTETAKGTFGILLIREFRQNIDKYGPKT